MKSRIMWTVLVLLALFSGQILAQRFRNPFRGEGWFPGVENVKTAREAENRSTPTPNWTNTLHFEKDVFTFTRLRYTRMNRGGPVWWNGGFWYSDFPDSDLNLSYRLQQMTAIHVDPRGRVIDITDKELYKYPWLYLIEPGLMALEDEEVVTLRKHLLNGAFMMVDDFWGTPQWENFERQMKKVFPERKFVDLTLDHPVFHGIFDLPGPLNALQIPNELIGKRARETSITWESHEGEECKDIHFRALFDDKGHMMVLACYNTDNGDGWEREGEDDYYFHRFCENIAFPLAINIIYYSMTH
jgi:hypothetical protein